jgi:serine/threonine-protein kinase
VDRSSPLPAVSRYEVIVEIASGGMGTVYVGRRTGAEGFQRLVAIKRSDPSLLKDSDLRRALVREAELAARIHHANVVSVIDVEQLPDELLLVLEYVEGGSLDALARKTGGRERWDLPPEVAIRVVLDTAAGLHAAHQLTDLDGQPLHIVHRDEIGRAHV